MKKIKSFNFSYLSISILLISILIISLLNYIDVLSVKFSNIFIYVIFFVLLVLNSFKIALKSKSKGIITGLKISFSITGLFAILKIISKLRFTWFSLLYFLLIFLFSIIASIYGSNKKSSNV